MKNVNTEFGHVSWTTVESDGPARYDWLECAALVAGRSKTLHVAMALTWLAVMAGEPRVALTRRTMKRWGLSRDATGDALLLLQAHRLIVVWSAPGRARVIILTEPGTTTALRLS